MFVIDDIINAILALSNVVKQAQRQESVLKILKKFNFDPKHPPADFTGVYQYALVEYGASQLGILNQEDLRLVLELFRQKEIKQAFERAFNGDNPRIFLNQVEKYIEEYALGDDISDRSINLLPELAKFSDIFIEIVKRTRNPAEVRRDRKLDNLQAELKSAIDQLNQRFESLDSLPEKISQNLLSLPAGDRPLFANSNFTQQLHNWFEALYDFEREDVWESDYFEWIVQVPARRRYDRILVRGIEGEANINDLKALEESVEKYNTDEGWLVAPSRVSQAVRDAVEGDRVLFCYTFDELIDEAVNFSGYLNWLETEVKRQKIDTLYVPLACTKEELDPKTQQSLGKSRYDQRNGWIDRYINTWLNDSAKEHLSILGEFGTGKTWFVFHYAWQAVQKYRTAKAEGNKLPRLPLVIPLRDYAKAVSVESLFSEFFFRQHDVGLPNYKAFEQLNRMGKLLLIFDGFDEMAAKVDRQKMINNFWELAKVVVPGSKAILTCRTEHFPEAKEGRDLLNAELQASTTNLSGEPPQFEVLELEKLNNEQIREVLCKREAKPETIAKIMANPELVDLARRPVMVNLILEALPEIESGKPIDLARIYLYAVRRKMERDIKTDRTFTSMADKLYFLCELAWEMLSTDQMSLNYRLFPDRIRRCFGKQVQEQKDLDHWHYDMMGQTLLIRNADGDYSPAHRSLLEFFVAYKFAVQLGILAPDFAEIATISFADNLRETFGQAPLTKALLDLLLPMLNLEIAKQRLFDLIAFTKGKTVAEVGYLGGNAATVLLKVDPTSLQNCDFSNTVILGADFTTANLRNVNFTNANLNESLFAKAFDFVYSLTFSPDGRFLATGHDNGEVCLWEVADGEQIAIYRGHSNSVRSVAIGPDGNILASGSDDNTIKLWDLHSGDCLQTLPGHSNPVKSVAISPDGNILASGSNDNTIKLWDIHSGHCLQTLQGHSNSVFSVAISPDGNILASGSYDNTIKLWDLHSGDCLQTLHGHNHWVRSVAISPDGNILASGSNDNTIKLWDLHSGDCLQTLPGHSNSVWSVAISPDGKTLASGSYDNTIKLWNIRSGHCLQTLQGHSNWVISVAYSADGKTLASGSSDKTIKLWDLHSGHCLQTLQEHRNLVFSVAYAPDGKTLASGGSDNTIKIWDLHSDHCLQTLQGHSNWVRSVAISPDGKTLASGSYDNTIKIWDIHSGDCLQTLPGHSNVIQSVAISPDGNILASGSDDQTIKLWDIHSGDCLQTLRGHRSVVWSVAISSDGKTLASGSSDGTIKIWDLQSGECLKTISNKLYAGAKIAGVTGLTAAEKASLIALGAVE